MTEQLAHGTCTLTYYRSLLIMHLHRTAPRKNPLTREARNPEEEEASLLRRRSDISRRDIQRPLFPRPQKRPFQCHFGLSSPIFLSLSFLSRKMAEISECCGKFGENCPLKKPSVNATTGNGNRGCPEEIWRHSNLEFRAISGTFSIWPHEEGEELPFLPPAGGAQLVRIKLSRISLCLPFPRS